MDVATQLGPLSFPHYYIVAMCVVCAATDLWTGKIYNAVTYPSILVGLAYHAIFVDRGVPVSSLIGFAAGVIPFGLAAWRGWIGGGDAKLFGAVGALGGVLLLVDFVFNVFILAGIYSIAVIVMHAIGALRGRTSRAEWFPRGRQVRLGVFIFLGSVLTTLGVSFIRYIQETRQL